MAIAGSGIELTETRRSRYLSRMKEMLQEEGIAITTKRYGFADKPVRRVESQIATLVGKGLNRAEVKRRESRQVQENSNGGSTALQTDMERVMQKRQPKKGQKPKLVKGDSLDRMALVRSIAGKYAHVPTSSEDFARRKQEEIDLEEI